MPATSTMSSRAIGALRIAATATLLAFGLFCAVLLAVRLVVLPQVEARRGEIVHWLSARLGQPVEIDALVTGWNGWNPQISVQGFRVRAQPPRDGVVLDLPRADLLIAWTSLPLLDLRLKELTVEGPRLSVRRDASGRLHVAGIERDADSSVNDAAFGDWLMRQPQIVVRDALVAWNDDYRHAPQLLLDHVTFRMEQRFGRHHAGLTGVPPAELAAPLEIRVEATGHALNDWTNLEGRLYFRVDYADIAAWREWVSLPVPIDAGKGAIRAWIDFQQSQPSQVTADVELEDVRATLGEGLAPVSIAHLGGRGAWKRAASRTEFTAKQASFTLADGSTQPPSDIALFIAAARENQPATGKLTFTELDLRPLAAVVPHLPLPDALRRDIGRYEPRGLVQNGTLEWTGTIDAPSRYSLKSEFRGLAVAAHDAMPGGTNLSGTVDASEAGGSLRLASEASTLELARLFADPLRFDTLRGDVRWKHDAESTELQFREVAFANGDAAGTLAGTWRSRVHGTPAVDLRAQLTRADIASAYRYVPIRAGVVVHDWLRRALAKGSSNDVKITVVGDLAQFPFAGKPGQFVFAAKVQDATLDYAEHWPAITNVAADVRIEGTRVAIAATGGRVLGAQISATRAEIADFHAPHPVLRIEGSANGPTSEFLAFIARSPVAEWIGGVTKDAIATGDGRLALQFDLPLREPSTVTINGQYQFASNTITATGVPPLAALTGSLSFTEKDVRTTDLAGEMFGGPLKLQVGHEGGRLRVTGSGTADLQLVRKYYDVALLDRVTGRTDWQLALESLDQRVGWTIESSLAGAAIDLPVPVRKAASERMPLRVERRELRSGDDRLVITLGSNLRGVVHRNLAGEKAVVDRALILLGKSATETSEAEQPGLWIRGDVATLNLDDWLDVEPGGTSASGRNATDALTLTGVDLTAGTLDVLGRTFTRLKSSARRQGNDWRLTLDGADLAGTAVWRAATATQPNGRIVARLSRLSTPPASDANASVPHAPSKSVTRWPEVDLVADALHAKDRTVGKLELLANPAGNDWQIRKLALVNDAGRIDADGSWRNVASRSQTTMNVAIDVKEAGEFLGRFGWPNAVKGAPTKINGRLSWDGAPSDFDYPSLTGSFKLQSGAGQFTKVDPGVGRLLGVLSLQALPRRISLDFRDVFSEGFAFDTIAADVRLQNGVMHTDDFRLVGPAAAVNIAGDVDLARETQQLKVRVQPALASGVSVGTAALFIANPLIGAAVGAGTLLAQKMLNNPFDKLFSYEYAIAGSFDDPTVARTGAAASAAAQSGASIR
jgi:uncharacterized protein (TIGR02099 family)